MDSNGRIETPRELDMYDARAIIERELERMDNAVTYAKEIGVTLSNTFMIARDVVEDMTDDMNRYVKLHKAFRRDG